MYGASQATAFNNDNAQAACSQMEFQCGPYYSYKEMTKAVPGCAKVPHKPTDAPREGDIHRNAPYDGQPGGDPSNPENQEAYDPKKDGKKSKGANHKGANHKKNHASKENGQKASVSAHKNSKSRRLAEEPEEDHGHDQEGSNDVVDRG